MADRFIPALIPGDIGYRPPSDDETDLCSCKSGSYVCTQASGHNDPHMAHGSDGQLLAVWYEPRTAEVIA